MNDKQNKTQKYTECVNYFADSLINQTKEENRKGNRERKNKGTKKNIAASFIHTK
jgi:hypothetical protein